MALINRNHKDTLFCRLFGAEDRKHDALQLYNALSGADHDDPDELGLNDTVGWYYADQGDQVLYNIIDFSTDAIELKSYSYTTGEQFNSLTLTKDSQKGGHPKGIPPVYQSFVYFAGTVYQFFNNINVYSRLKDSGFDVSLFDTVFRLNK